MHCNYIEVFVISLAFVLHAAAQITIKPTYISIKENEKNQKRVAELTIPKSCCDDCPCSEGKTEKLFGIWRTGSRKYGVFYLGESAGRLNYKKQRIYPLTFSCNALNDTQDSCSVQPQVNVLPNEPPYFVNASDYRKVEVPQPNGNIVYRVNAQDPDSDVLRFSFKRVDDVNFLKINPNTGQIFIADTPELYRAANRSIVLQVEVTDGQSTVDNFYLTVNIINVYIPPDLPDLPVSIRIKENSTTGFPKELTKSYWRKLNSMVKSSCKVEPTDHMDKFDITENVSSIQVKLVVPFDYETMPKLYTITCEISDGHMSSGEKKLTVIVINENEPPVFEDHQFYCTIDESQENSGASSCKLGTENFLQDPDGDAIASVDVTVTTTGQVQPQFRFIKATRTLMLQSDYDVDNTQLSTSLDLELTAKDVYGASSSAKVTVFIRDINDNTCAFPEISNVTVTANSPPKLPSIQAPDRDRTSPNNRVTYTFVSAQPPESRNYIALSPDGKIYYLGQIPESDKRQIFTYVFRCQDGGIPVKHINETTLVLVYEPLVTTTTSTTTTTTTIPTSPTTTESSDVWDDSTFVGVFAGLMCLLLLALLLGVVLCCRYCGKSESGLTSCLKEFFCPKPVPQKVVPEDDNMVFSVRTNPDYKDEYWKQGDSFETGKQKEKNDPLAGAPVLYPKPGTSTAFKF